MTIHTALVRMKATVDHMQTDDCVPITLFTNVGGPQRSDPCRREISALSFSIAVAPYTSVCPRLSAFYKFWLAPIVVSDIP